MIYDKKHYDKYEVHCWKVTKKEIKLYSKRKLEQMACETCIMRYEKITKNYCGNDCPTLLSNIDSGPLIYCFNKIKI